MFIGDKVRVTSGLHYGAQGTVTDISLHTFSDPTFPEFNNGEIVITFLSTQGDEYFAVNGADVEKVW